MYALQGPKPQSPPCGPCGGSPDGLKINVHSISGRDHKEQDLLLSESSHAPDNKPCTKVKYHYMFGGISIMGGGVVYY